MHLLLRLPLLLYPITQVPWVYNSFRWNSWKSLIEIPRKSDSEDLEESEVGEGRVDSCQTRYLFPLEDVDFLLPVYATEQIPDPPKTFSVQDSLSGLVEPQGRVFPMRLAIKDLVVVGLLLLESRFPFGS